MVDSDKYKDFSNELIKLDLENQGYNPLLIKEAPNDSLASHKHNASHILVVTDGEMRIVLTDQEIVMKPGDKITIDSEVEHAAFFGPSGCSYFWVEF